MQAMQPHLAVLASQTLLHMSSLCCDLACTGLLASSRLSERSHIRAPQMCHSACRIRHGLLVSTTWLPSNVLSRVFDLTGFTVQAALWCGPQPGAAATQGWLDLQGTCMRHRAFSRPVHLKQHNSIGLLHGMPQTSEHQLTYCSCQQSCAQTLMQFQPKAQAEGSSSACKSEAMQRGGSLCMGCRSPQRSCEADLYERAMPSKYAEPALQSLSSSQ